MPDSRRPVRRHGGDAVQRVDSNATVREPMPRQNRPRALASFETHTHIRGPRHHTLVTVIRPLHTHTRMPATYTCIQRDAQCTYISLLTLNLRARSATCLDSTAPIQRTIQTGDLHHYVFLQNSTCNHIAINLQVFAGDSDLFGAQLCVCVSVCVLCRTVQ